MPSNDNRAETSRNRFMEGLCECLPNCTKALDLLDTGTQRELTILEKAKLKYNSRLCPFCACASGRYDSAMARMKEAQALRNIGD